MIRRFKTDFKGMRNFLKRQQMGDFFCRPVASVLKVGGGDRLKQKFLTAKKKKDRFENNDIPYQECDGGGVVVYFIFNCLIYTSIFKCSQKVGRSTP